MTYTDITPSQLPVPVTVPGTVQTTFMHSGHILTHCHSYIHHKTPMAHMEQCRGWQRVTSLAIRTVTTSCFCMLRISTQAYETDIGKSRAMLKPAVILQWLITCTR